MTAGELEARRTKASVAAYALARLLDDENCKAFLPMV
jgi:hypothetical protein